MTSRDFFQSEAVTRLLQRIHLAAGAPVAIHVITQDSGVELITSNGMCPVCAFFPGNSKLHVTCMDSLKRALAQAVKKKYLVPFICPMGFSCVSICMDPRAGLVLTIGPYCPDDAEESLLLDLKRGLMRLGLDPTPAERLARKIHRAPASCIPEITLWAVDDLLNIFRQRRAGERDVVENVDEEPNEVSVLSKSSKRKSRRPVTFGQAVAVALASGDQTQYKRLILLRLSSEMEGGENPPVALLRARVLVLLGEVLTGISATDLFEEAHRDVRYQELAAVEQIDTIEAALDFFKRFWGILPHPSGINQEMRALVRRLNELLMKDIVHYGSLSEVACSLGIHPSTFSGKFKQAFGVSFTDYVNRLRVEKAKALLKLKSISIDEVARRVGLGNSGSLNRLFREMEGFSASYFRRY
ncbi:MAG TPA: helix-turn-helix domain-containing protein [Candidatus Hydrogenedentes bacterium]|nr:helix-turn-helix domain-containing protein [Candidatus Hydrogenedentota bacterium]HOL77707.1 helix-turn-helix domain-containing protein [Candidatus Hydrogenedentota bacterium]HPO86830.1 helix-turn-helix domain-containing protein [Candidatus Hydrogenedentota bacterium]